MSGERSEEAPQSREVHSLDVSEQMQAFHRCVVARAPSCKHLPLNLSDCLKQLPKVSRKCRHPLLLPPLPLICGAQTPHPHSSANT